MELTKDENVYKITKELEIINGLKYLTVEVEDQNGKKIYGKRSPPEVEFSWEYDEKQNMICYKNSLGLRIVREYDEKGNVIHYKDTNGSEWRYEYDQNGNEIHRVSSTGSQIWQDYDVDGKLIHYRNSSGYEYHQEYDNNGKVSHFKDSTGEDYWYEYNEKGQKIGAKDSDGKVLWKSEYNEQNQEVHTKFSTGLEYWEKYDENGNLVSFKSSNGHEKTSEYSTLIIPQGVDLLETIKERVEGLLQKDLEVKEMEMNQTFKMIRTTEIADDGNKTIGITVIGNNKKYIYSKNSKGVERWSKYEYDENGNQIYQRDSDGFEENWQYDDKGNEIHFENSEGLQHWKDYDQNGNLVHYRDTNKLEYWSKFNENGQEISRRTSEKLESWYEYDQRGNLIHASNSEGYQEWWKYNEDGKVTHYKDTDGDEKTWKYDEYGVLRTIEDSDGNRYSYNVKGDLIHSKHPRMFENWSEYLTLTIPQGVDLMKVIKEKVEQGFTKPQEKEQVYKIQKVTMNGSEGQRVVVEVRNQENNVVYFKGTNGDEVWYDYNDMGKLAHLKTSFGREEWYEYDQSGKEIHFRDNFGVKRSNVYEYDEKGRIIFHIHPDNCQDFYEYDENGGYFVSLKDPDGKFLSLKKYDQKGNITYSKNNFGDISFYEYEYNDLGQKTYCKHSKGEQEWWEYNADGKVSVYTSSSGYVESHEYDEKGNEIHLKESHGEEIWSKYDKDGNLIHSVNNLGGESKYEYSTITIPQGVDLMETIKERVEQELTKPHVEKMQDEQTYKVKKTIEVDYNSGNKTTIQILNANNEVLYSKDSTGYEEWRQYDEKGNKIHERNSEGFEKSWQYDDKGNEIYYKNSHGYEMSREYDEKGNQIYQRNSNGLVISTEYDEKGNKIYQRYSDGFKESWQYDDKGNEIHFENSRGNEISREYDEKGNQIHQRCSDGFEKSWQYDEKGNKIYQRNSYGFEESWQYDEKGNKINYKNSHGYEKNWQYDKNGQLIHYKDSKGSEGWNEYSSLNIPQGVDLMEAFKERVEQQLAKPQKLDECLREDFRLKSKKELSINERVLYVDENVLKVAQVASVSEDDGSIHIRSVPAPIRQKSSQLLNQQVKLEDKRLIKDDNDLYRYLAKNVGGEKGFVISDSVRLGGYKGLIKIESVKNISLQPKFDGKEVIRSCFVECADNNWKFDLRSGQDKLENTTIEANSDQRVHFVTDIDSAVNLVKDISDMGFNLSHHFEYAVNNPKEAFLEIKDHYYMIDYKIDPYIEGLAKTNKENHYLDELLYESCIESNESLFEKLVNAGADLSWRRNECGKSCNILHYTAADLLVYATELVIDRLVKDGKVDLLTEMLNEDNFENLSPNEVWKLRVEDVKELDDGVHYARDLHFLASQKIDEQHEGRQQLENSLSMSKTKEKDVVKDFLGKVKESLPDKVGIDELFKVSAIILDGYNKDEKASIGSYLAGIGADNKNNLGKFLSEVLDVKQDRTPPSRKTGGDNFSRER